jgi:hypothetical protein
MKTMTDTETQHEQTASGALKADRALAIQHLQTLRLEGPWLLTAIIPDGDTITITARSAEDVDAFIRKYDGKRNFYYSVNPTRTAMDKKAAKTDIAKIEYALADLDPNPGETSEAAKARYQDKLDNAFDPKPTALVDSGNGLQCLWKLDLPIVLGQPIKVKNDKGKIELKFNAEDQAKIDDVEARVKETMLRLGGKPGTQNIDRILRLPGTINLPNAKKLREGRGPCPTALLWFNGASYPLSAFPGRADGNGHDPSEFFTAFGDYVAKEYGHHERDQSGSGHGFRFMRGCRARGMTFEQASEAIWADPNEAGEWANRVDDRQIRRAWDRSGAAAEQQQTGKTNSNKGAAAEIPVFDNTDWCDVSKIERRRWLYGQHHIRGFATASIGDGGTGKSTKAIAEGICMSTGQELLGIPVNEQVKVWYWNGEEPRVEIARRVHAVCEHYKLDPYKVAKNFRFTSGLDELPIKIVNSSNNGVAIDRALANNIVEYIEANDIGVMIIDPLISCHGVPENDNNGMDVVAKTWGRIAALTNIGLELVHHTRKSLKGGEGGETFASDARGAGALIAAVRSSRVFNLMTEKEAGEFNIEDRFAYFRTNRAKVNMTKRSSAAWYQLTSVIIGNGSDGMPGDNVQTVTAWKPPEVLDVINTTAHMHAVRAKIAAENEHHRYRRDRRATKWIGNIIAEVTGLPFEGQGTLIEQIIKSWVGLGAPPSFFYPLQKGKNFSTPVSTPIGGWRTGELEKCFLGGDQFLQSLQSFSSSQTVTGETSFGPVSRLDKDAAASTFRPIRRQSIL